MNRLGDIRILKESTVSGTLIAVVCLPYLRHSDVILSPLSVPLLFILTIIMWQIYLAWTPPDILNRSLASVCRNKRLYVIIVAYIPILFAQMLCLDSWFEDNLPQFRPANIIEVAVTLPWVMTFQILFLVAVQYAFANRLFKNSAVAVITVVLFNQCITLIQTIELSTIVATVAVAVTGIQALFFCVTYRLIGFPGLSLVTGLTYCRFIFTL